MCTNCKETSSSSIKKCDSCLQHTMEEVVEEKSKNKSRKINPIKNPSATLSSIQVEDNLRYSSNISEIDRVLGGGFILGSSIVIGGEPGIGKSTLALQLGNLANDDFKFMYFSGEESQKQIKLRAKRIGVDSDNVILSEHNNLEDIINEIKQSKPSFVIIDSIHTMTSDESASIAGSVNQVTNCSNQLAELSRALSFTLILVGHITKEGIIAGPKVLEHLVDTILYFEKIDTGNLRILRTSKNRFGATDEIGIFNMTEKGLEEIVDPTSLFLSNKKEASPGSAISSTHEGTRPMLVEIQSLVSNPTQSFGKRYSTGIDSNRVNLLVAILEKYCDIRLSDKDIFVSLTKGIKVKDTSNDLASAVAIYSSFRNVPISNENVFIGELGLSGEVKEIDNIEKRVKEIARLGFKSCFVPINSVNDAKSVAGKLKIRGIEHIKEIKDFF